ERLWHPTGLHLGAFSPDGRRFLTLSDDSLRVWDADGRRQVIEPIHHPGKGQFRHALFSPDGRRLVTTSTDTTVRVWDAGTGRPLGQPLHHRALPEQGVAFSPDGALLATADDGDYGVRLWDAAAGQASSEPLLHLGKITTLVFSPDGRFLLTGSEDRTARLWQLAPGRLVETARPSESARWAVSPDGKRAWSSGPDRLIRLWDTATGKLVAGPLGAASGLAWPAFSPDGRVLVSTARDYTKGTAEVRVWEAATGKPVGETLALPYTPARTFFS